MKDQNTNEYREIPEKCKVLLPFFTFWKYPGSINGVKLKINFHTK